MGRYDNLPEADVVVNHIHTRFKKGLGTNTLVIGLSGTGKTSTCFRVGERRKEEGAKEGLDITLFIVDSLLKLIDAIRNSKEGDVLVIEEVSVLFPSRRAMAGENVAVGKIFDTIRKKRLCIISNAPLWNSIDTHIKSMAHILIETLRINRTECVVISKFHRVQTNPRSSKIYLHTMQRNGRDVQRMFTRMPNSERWRKYEEEKEIFMDELYEELKHTQGKKRQKLLLDMGKLQPRMRDLTKRELEVQVLHHKGLNQREIGEKLGIVQQRVAGILKNVVKKVGSVRKMPENKGVTTINAL